VIQSKTPKCLSISTLSIKKGLDVTPLIERTCGLEDTLSDRTQLLISEHIFATYLERQPQLGIAGFSAAGIYPYSPALVLRRCAPRESRAVARTPVAVDGSRTPRGDLETIIAFVGDPEMTPVTKFRNIRELSASRATPVRLLDRYGKVGIEEIAATRNAAGAKFEKTKSQRRVTSEKALTLGDVEDAINATGSNRIKKPKFDEDVVDKDRSDEDDFELVTKKV